jgi:hypothetical protein
MKVQIVFKSGAQIEADVDEISTFRNQLTNEITKLKWTTPDGWKRKLHTIQLSEIAAIVIIDPDI